MTPNCRLGVDRFVRVVALATVATLAVVLLGSIAFLRSPELRAASGLTETAAPRGYAVGQVVDVGPELFRETRFTVLMFVNSTCRACVANEPLYSELRNKLKGSASAVKLIGVSFDRGFGEYAARIGVPASDRATLTLSAIEALKLDAVPTLLLVDHEGTILFKAVGNHETERQELIDAIRTTIGYKTD